MPDTFANTTGPSQSKTWLQHRGHDLGDLPGWIFEGRLIYADQLGAHGQTLLSQKSPDLRMEQACNIARFAGALVTDDLKEGVTHILVIGDRDRSRILRQMISR